MNRSHVGSDFHPQAGRHGHAATARLRLRGPRARGAARLAPGRHRAYGVSRGALGDGAGGGGLLHRRRPPPAAAHRRRGASAPRAMPSFARRLPTPACTRRSTGCSFGGACRSIPSRIPRCDGSRSSTGPRAISGARSPWRASTSSARSATRSSRGRNCSPASTLASPGCSSGTATRRWSTRRCSSTRSTQHEATGSTPTPSASPGCGSPSSSSPSRCPSVVYRILASAGAAHDLDAWRGLIRFVFGRGGMLRGRWRAVAAYHRRNFHPWRYLDNRRLLSELRDTIVDPAWEVRAR